jgi:hypothetical protein
MDALSQNVNGYFKIILRVIDGKSHDEFTYIATEKKVGFGREDPRRVNHQ